MNNERPSFALREPAEMAVNYVLIFHITASFVDFFYAISPVNDVFESYFMFIGSPVFTNFYVFCVSFVFTRSTIIQSESEIIGGRPLLNTGVVIMLRAVCDTKFTLFYFPGKHWDEMKQGRVKLVKQL